MKKTPNPTDRHVGARVRMRRMMLNLTQEKLASALDLTFQQVQKYEKGTNRIGASRLQQIATTLQVPVAFFFDGLPTTAGKPGQPAAIFLTEFLASSHGLRLATAFMALPDAKVQARFVELAEQMAAAVPAWRDVARRSA